MNVLYVKARATALRLIKKNGASFSLYRFTNTVDAVAGSAAVVANRGTVYAVVLPASKGTIEAFDNRYADELISGKIRFAICAAKGATLTPIAGDVMSYSDEYWQIMGSTPLDPDQSGAIILKFGMVKTNLTAEQIAAIEDAGEALPDFDSEDFA